MPAKNSNFNVIIISEKVISVPGSITKAPLNCFYHRIVLVETEQQIPGSQQALNLCTDQNK